MPTITPTQIYRASPRRLCRLVSQLLCPVACVSQRSWPYIARPDGKLTELHADDATRELDRMERPGRPAWSREFDCSAECSAPTTALFITDLRSVKHTVARLLPSLFTLRGMALFASDPAANSNNPQNEPGLIRSALLFLFSLFTGKSFLLFHSSLSKDRVSHSVCAALRFGAI
jgi:hypothetical protein